MNTESYIKAGDEISVMFRSLALVGFCGTVLEVREGEPAHAQLSSSVPMIAPLGVVSPRCRKTRLCSASAGAIPGWTFPASCRWPRRRRRLAARWSMKQKRIQKKVPLFAVTKCQSPHPFSHRMGRRACVVQVTRTLQRATKPPFRQPRSGRRCRNVSRQASIKRSSHPVSATRGVDDGMIFSVKSSSTTSSAKARRTILF